LLFSLLLKFLPTLTRVSLSPWERAVKKKARERGNMGRRCVSNYCDSKARAAREREREKGFELEKGKWNNSRKRKLFPEKSNPRVREEGHLYLFRSSCDQWPSYAVPRIYEPLFPYHSHFLARIVYLLFNVIILTSKHLIPLFHYFIQIIYIDKILLVTIINYLKMSKGILLKKKMSKDVF